MNPRVLMAAAISLVMLGSPVAALAREDQFHNLDRAVENPLVVPPSDESFAIRQDPWVTRGFLDRANRPFGFHGDYRPDRADRFRITAYVFSEPAGPRDVRTLRAFDANDWDPRFTLDSSEANFTGASCSFYAEYAVGDRTHEIEGTIHVQEQIGLPLIRYEVVSMSGGDCEWERGQWGAFAAALQITRTPHRFSPVFSIEFELTYRDTFHLKGPEYLFIGGWAFPRETWTEHVRINVTPASLAVSDRARRSLVSVRVFGVNL